MDRLEYYIRLKEAREIAHEQKWEKKIEKHKTKRIQVLTFLTLVVWVLASFKGIQ